MTHYVFTENEAEDDDIESIAEELKTNTTLTSLNLACQT